MIAAVFDAALLCGRTGWCVELWQEDLVMLILASRVIVP